MYEGSLDFKRMSLIKHEYDKNAFNTLPSATMTKNRLRKYAAIKLSNKA